MFCPNCGKEGNTAFCINCGAKMPDPSPVRPTSAEVPIFPLLPETNQPAQPMFSFDTPTPQKKKRFYSSWWFITICALVGALIVGIVGLSMLGGMLKGVSTPSNRGVTTSSPSSSEVATSEIIESAKNGYEYAEPEKYTSSATGLFGSKIYIEGKLESVKKVGITVHSFVIMTPDSKAWAITGMTDDQLDFLHEGDAVTAYGEYLGFVDMGKTPTMLMLRLDVNGQTYKFLSMEEFAAKLKQDINSSQSNSEATSGDSENSSAGLALGHNYNTLYEPSRGISISLGMNKDSVDKLLGKSMHVDGGDYYFYDNDTLAISFKNGKIENIFCDGGRWMTKGGIIIGSSRSDVSEAIGDGFAVDNDLQFWISDKHEIIDSFLGDASYALVFEFEGGDVNEIHLQSFID